MAVHLTEEEQLEALKRWWSENGKTLTIAVAVALAGFWGWNQYQAHQEQKAEDSSAAFQKLVDGINGLEGAADQATQKAELQVLASELASDHGDTLYGNFAQLYVAKQAVDDGNAEKAKEILLAVIDHPANDAVKDLARLRLARVTFSAGDADGALQLLQGKVSEAFASFYDEIKGDIHLAQENLSDARSAYQRAFDGLEASDFMRRNLLQLKLDNTKVATDLPDIAPDDLHGDASTSAQTKAGLAEDA